MVEGHERQHMGPYVWVSVNKFEEPRGKWYGVRGEERVETVGPCS